MALYSTAQEYTDYINSDEFDVSTHGQTNVFYSGNYWTNPETGQGEGLNRKTAEGHYSSEGLADQDGMTLEQTAGGKWLEEENVYSQFSDEDAKSIWNAASDKYAASASGDVVAVIHDADPTKTFGSVELPTLLQNEQVDSINGVSRTELASTYDADQSEDKSQATNEIFGKIDNTYYSAKEAENAQEAPSGAGVPIDPGPQDIPELVNNEAVSSINSVSREELKNTYDQNPDQAQGREAVMEEISQPSLQNEATEAASPAAASAGAADTQPDAQQSALAAAQSARGSSEETSSEPTAEQSALAAARNARSSSEDTPSEPSDGQQAVANAEKARTEPEPAPSNNSQEPSSTPSGPPPDDFGP